MYQVIGRDSCPYCIAAKKLLDSKGIEYSWFDEKSTSYRIIKSEGKTVPQIWDDKGDRIGGYTDLAASFMESEEHNTAQKIQWWVVTILYLVIGHSKFAIRMKARKNCIDSCKS